MNEKAKRGCIDRVRREIADVRVVELADASHDCLLDRDRDVVETMRAFPG